MAYQTHSLGKKFFWIFWIIFGVFCLYFLYFLWRDNYQDFTYSLLSYQHRVGKLEVLRTKILTPTLFLVLRIGNILILILWGILLFFKHSLSRLLESIFRQFQGIISKEVTFVSALSQWELSLLIFTLLSIGIIQITCSFFLPVQEDEAFTFVYFVHPGFAVSASYYPGPNNHVFYSLLVCLFKPLSIHPLWLLRLPNIIISLLNNYLIFRILIKKYNYFLSILGIIIFSFLPFNFLYSFLGRGYTLQLFFLLIAFIIQSQKNIQNKIFRFIWILSCSLGFYTIPTFLYPFTTFIFLRVWNRENIKRVIIDSFLVLSFAIALYSPILLFNSQTFLNNHWIQPSFDSLLFYQIFTYWGKNFSELFYLNYGVLWVSGSLILLLYLKVIRKKKSKFLGLTTFLTFIFISLSLTLIQQVLPPTRVWMYLGFFFVWASLEVISLFKWQKLLTISLSVYFITLSIHSFYNLDKKGGSFREVSRQIIQSKPKLIYTNIPTYFTFLLYEKVIQKNKVIITDKVSSNQQPEVIILKKEKYSELGDLNDYQVEYYDNEIEILKLSTNQ